MFNRKGLLIMICLGVSLNAWGMDDPTRPVGYTGPPPAGMTKKEDGKHKLTSIIYSDERRIAIIDGIPWQKGDTHDGDKLLDISESAVLIETDEGQVRLQLNPYEIKGQQD